MLLLCMKFSFSFNPLHFNTVSLRILPTYTFNRQIVAFLVFCFVSMENELFWRACGKNIIMFHIASPCCIMSEFNTTRIKLVYANTLKFKAHFNDNMWECRAYTKILQIIIYLFILILVPLLIKFYSVDIISSNISWLYNLANRISV